MHASSAGPAPPPVRLYRRPWRGVAAALFSLSRLILPFMLWRVLVASDPPVTPFMLARTLFILAVLPGAAAWLIGRAFAFRAVADAGGVTFRRGNAVLTVGRDAVESVGVGWLPLPEPGLTIRRRAGQAALRVGARDPAPLLAALDPAAARHPVAVYAAARAARRGRGYWLGRYVFFPLLPAAVLFNAHQHIAYGALLGQYYQQGIGAWLATAGVYWATTAAYAVLYASCWRGLAELVAYATAWVAPAAAAPVRRVAEATCAAAFWLGIPAILALRFLG